jgi:hypothetical protein
MVSKLFSDQTKVFTLMCMVANNRRLRTHEKSRYSSENSYAAIRILSAGVEYRITWFLLYQIAYRLMSKFWDLNDLNGYRLIEKRISVGMGC